MLASPPALEVAKEVHSGSVPAKCQILAWAHYLQPLSPRAQHCLVVSLAQWGCQAVQPAAMSVGAAHLPWKPKLSARPVSPGDETAVAASSLPRRICWVGAMSHPSSKSLWAITPVQVHLLPPFLLSGTDPLCHHQVLSLGPPTLLSRKKQLYPCSLSTEVL